MTGRRPADRSWSGRFEAWLVRSYVWGPSRRTVPPTGPVPEEPVGPGPRPTVVRVASAVLGLLLPLLVGALLVPFREVLAPTTQTLVLVLPVVAVAVLGDRSSAVLAAASAALTFDVLLTEPYYSLRIQAVDDLEAALVLGLIGVLVGTVVAREVAARARASSRAVELAVLSEAARVAALDEPETLAATVADGVTELLGVRSCEWLPGFHGRIGAVMAADGSFAGWDGAALPSGTVEIPVVRAGHELGRLLVRATGAEVVSVEQRRTALALADLLAASVSGDT